MTRLGGDLRPQHSGHRIGLAPAGVSAVEAASLVVAGSTAALRDLGADEVVDYGTTSGEMGPFDVISTRSARRCTTTAADWPRRPDGHRGTVGPRTGAIAASTIHGARRIRTFSANPDSPVLDDLADHVSSGALRPTVHSVYPLTDIAAARRAFERGGVMGKHVLTISH